VTDVEYKSFYRTQRNLAIAINQIVDDYWNEKMKEAEFIQCIRVIYANNTEKLVKNNQFTTVVQQQCGKRRLAVVEKILQIK